MATRNEKVQILVNAKDKTRGVLGNVKNQIIGMASAYGAWRVATDIIGASIKKAADYQAILVSLKSVTEATGRSQTEIYGEIEKRLGGLASKAQLTEGFLKGMTTELNVQQIGKLTDSIKDASLAMGEDFGQQLPLIIKAIKQLNPAILDNIGVTVRLDQVNKKIREGYYGLNKEISEATQQNAIFQEIMRQTAKYQGQEEAILKTNKGAWAKLTAAIDDASVAFGTMISEGEAAVSVMDAMTLAMQDLTDAMSEGGGVTETLAVIWFNLTGQIAKSVAVAHRAAEETKRMNIKLVSAHQQRLKEQQAANEKYWANFLEELHEFYDAPGGVNDITAQALKKKQQMYYDTNTVIDQALQIEKDLTKKALDDSESLWKETNRLAQKEIKKITDAATEQVSAFLHAWNAGLIWIKHAAAAALEVAVVQSMHNTVERMLGEWKWLQEETRGIFKAMAQDFVYYFASTVLHTLADVVIGTIGGGGILGLLSKLFDTPANDRMAMIQGTHFAMWFARGMQEKLQSIFNSQEYQQTWKLYGTQPAIGPGYSVMPGRQSHGGTYQSDSMMDTLGITPIEGQPGRYRRAGYREFVSVSMYNFREEQIAALIERAAANNRLHINPKSQNLTGDAAFNPV